MIKDILSVSVSDVEIKRLFNQNRDIFHHRRERLQTKIIETLIILHIHTNRNSNNTDKILNTNDSKLNEQYSKNELENDHRDIDVFVETNLQDEFYVSSNNDFNNLMKEDTILNKNDEFENSKFDDLRDESFDDIFVNKEMTTKETNVATTMSKNKISKKHRQSQISLNTNRQRFLKIN